MVVFEDVVVDIGEFVRGASFANNDHVVCDARDISDITKVPVTDNVCASHREAVICVGDDTDE